MRYIIVILFLSLVLHPVMAQKTFTLRGERIEIIRELHLSPAIQHDAPVAASDHEWIQVFKKYFHPASFQSFKSFFHGKDWPGFTNEQFEAWQASLQQNKLALQHVMHLKDKAGQEYLVYLYVMETPQHSLYQSKAMKKVNGVWKHRPLEDGSLTDILESIGSLDPGFLNENDEADVISLEHVPPSHFRRYREKFDRSALFQKIQMVLESKSMTATHIQQAKSLFIAGNDQGMIEYVTKVTSLDDILLMKSINESCGFRLFNYFHSNESN